MSLVLICAAGNGFEVVVCSVTERTSKIWTKTNAWEKERQNYAPSYLQ